MRLVFWLGLLAACSSSSSKQEAVVPGRIVVAMTIDWEGAYLSPDGLDALDEMRKSFGPIPVTHFVSAGYFTKPTPDPKLAETFSLELQKGDELALHLHGWRSLAKAAGIEPKVSPSFLTGTPKLMEFEDGDVGFDLDLDAYNVTELRALVRTSKKLFEQAKLTVSTTFRAGGYLGTPKVLEAIRNEGFEVDSSAADYRQLDERAHELLPKRVQAIWPKVEASSQPWMIEVPGGWLLEMPIAAFVDYSPADEVVGVFDAALARLRKEPNQDVFVVLGFHQETAHEFGTRMTEALTRVRARKELADVLDFTTLAAASARARRAR